MKTQYKKNNGRVLDKLPSDMVQGDRVERRFILEGPVPDVANKNEWQAIGGLWVSPWETIIYA